MKKADKELYVKHGIDPSRHVTFRAGMAISNVIYAIAKDEQRYARFSRAHQEALHAASSQFPRDARGYNAAVERFALQQLAELEVG